MLITTIISTIIPTVICLNFVAHYRQNASLQLQLADGWIQGNYRLTRDTSMAYYSYEGIPYAKPPVGHLRFQPPQPPDRWYEVLDANGNVPICMQIPPKSDQFQESEDCLYINVYTPINPNLWNSSNLLPVMVWIYGGAFLTGQATSSYYMPDYLIEQNVIVVHFNYRLNIFGFLSTGDMAAPGNYGLKDQQFALDWVQKNIKRFGGDPGGVTIFGESAGGVSVQLQLLSMKNQNRFHQAVSQSGSALCQWALQTSPRAIANEVGIVLGIIPWNTFDLIEQLRNITTQDLVTAAIKVAIMNSLNVVNSLPFGPTIEPNHRDAFLSELPYKLMEAGQFLRIPYIIGFNSEESALIQPILEPVESILQMIDTDPNILVSPSLIVDNNRKRIIGEQIKQVYFMNDKPKSRQYIEYISDVYFYRPILKSAKFFAEYTPTYLYRFSYEGYYLGRKSMNFHQNQKINGVMHTEDIWYLFGRSDLTQINQTDQIIRDLMVNLWTNFAKYQQPILTNIYPDFKWPIINDNNQLIYLDINIPLSLKYNPRDKTMEFWDMIFEKYGQSPFLTY